MPFTLLLAYVQAANWMEGAPTAWLAADEVAAEKTFNQLKLICRPNPQ